MKRTLALVVLLTSILFSQTDFWSMYNFNSQLNSYLKLGDEVCYSTTTTQLLKSVNYGLTWDTIYSTSFPCPEGTLLMLYTGLVDSQFHYLIIQQWNSSTGCYDVPVRYSRDGGANWEILISPSNYFRDFAINSNGTFYLLSDTLYSSVNEGQTWEPVNIPVEGRLDEIEIDTEDNLYISKLHSFDLGGITLRRDEVHISTNSAQTWEYIFGSSFDPGGGFRNIFKVPENGIMASEPALSKTKHFKRDYYFKEYPFEIISAITNDDYLYASTFEGFQYSTNSGQNWNFENSGLSNLYTKSLVQDTLGYFYILTNSGILKSNFSSYIFNIDSFFTFIDTKILDTTFKEIVIKNPFSFSLKIDSIKYSASNFYLSHISNNVIEPHDSTMIEFGFIPDSLGIFKDTVTIFTNNIVSRFYLSADCPKPTLIALPYSNFGSVQVGDTASTIIKLTSESINKIVIDTAYTVINDLFFLEQKVYPFEINYQDTIFLTVYFAPNNQSILPKKDTLKIISNCTNGTLNLLVTGKGVNPTDTEESEKIIDSYKLSESYPNPFNPTTTIEYQVPKTSNVKISVFNLVGEEIAILVDEEKNQGNYKVEFNGSSLSSGVYFYKMQAENFTSTKKFVLLK